MSGRSTVILSRFPSHLSLTDPGKRFGRVAEAISDELDVLGRQIGDVRRAHRLAEAPTTLDVQRIGELHGIGTSSYRLLDLRIDELATADPTDTALLAVLTNVPADDLDALAPDVREAAVAAAVAFRRRLDGLRRTVTAVIEAHCFGNATPVALLAATAAYLGFDLDPTDVEHRADRWWHTAPVLDRVTDDVGGVAPEPELLALEENPFVAASMSPVARRHADRFRIRRGGLEDVVTSVVVVGIGDRTVAPMVVNLDAGQGVVFDGTVPDGVELVIGDGGRATLGPVDVTGSTFRFSGGVFADAGETHRADFVFGENATGDGVATWVVTSPVANGFDQAPTLPHGGTITGLPLALGESRWACFARLAHYGTGDRAAIARNGAGRFDQSVFVGSPTDPFGEIGFRWSEREPFALRVLIPQRLAALDDETGTTLREPLRALLDRHRAAGVHLAVEYAEPRWDLGDGIARDADSTEPLGTVVVGTTLWPDGTPQPAPD